MASPWPPHGLIVAPDPRVDRGAVVEDGQGAMGHIQCSSEGRSARRSAELVVQLPPRTEKTNEEIKDGDSVAGRQAISEPNSMLVKFIRNCDLARPTVGTATISICLELPAKHRSRSII